MDNRKSRSKHRPRGEKDIWGNPKMEKLLEQPLGSPIELTKEEAIEVIHRAAGRRPDMSPSAEFIRKVRPRIGYSMEERIKKQYE